MKKFALKMLCFILPFIILITTINYYIDPANLFKNGSYELGIAKIWVQKGNVVNIENFDERILQKDYIEMINTSKETIILGSSRVMMIGNNIICDSVMNNAVSGASLEDEMAIYWMYRKKQILPKKILIGLDPWILNRNNKQERWKSIGKEYNEIKKYLGEKDEKIEKNNKIIQMVSLTYFQQSFKMLLSNIKNKKKEYRKTNKVEDVETIRLNDGRIVYDLKTRNLTQEKIDLSATGYANQNEIYSLGKYSEIDLELKNRFEKFIKLIKDDGVEVKFILPPYHPIVYKKIENDNKNKMVLEAEKYFREYSIKNNINIYGSYNPKLLGLINVDFFDGMHPKDEAVKKYIIIKN